MVGILVLIAFLAALFVLAGAKLLGVTNLSWLAIAVICLCAAWASPFVTGYLFKRKGD